MSRFPLVSTATDLYTTLALELNHARNRVKLAYYGLMYGLPDRYFVENELTDVRDALVDRYPELRREPCASANDTNRAS